MNDVDRAVAKAEVAAKLPVPEITAGVDLGHGRFARFAIPGDMTEDELLRFIWTLSGQVRKDLHLTREAGPKPHLWAPS